MGRGQAGRDVLERVASADPEERYAACLELRDRKRLEEPEVRALIAELDDPGRAAALAPVAAGGYPEVDIADAAVDALAHHAAGHLPLLREAARTGSERQRAAMARLLPARPPWTDLLDLLADDAPAVRMAVLARLAVVLAASARSPVRFDDIARAILRCLLDPDRMVVDTALHIMQRHDDPTTAAVFERAAASLPELVPALVERLDGRSGGARGAASALAWFRGRHEVIEALAAVVRAGGDAALDAASSLTRLGQAAVPTILELVRALDQTERELPPLVRAAIELLREHILRAGRRTVGQS